MFDSRFCGNAGKETSLWSAGVRFSGFLPTHSLLTGGAEWGKEETLMPCRLCLSIHKTTGALCTVL